MKPAPPNWDNTLTIFGRNPVLEALRDGEVIPARLHLASSNRPSPAVKEAVQLAESRGASVHYHTRLELSRISRNGKQDQGMVLDVTCPEFTSLTDFLASHQAGSAYRLLALDGITNPQNLGMIIRSACAGNIDGILISERGNASLGPLVIKASAGTLFRAPLIRIKKLRESLLALQERGATLCALEGSATQSLFDYRQPEAVIYVLGNESVGVSQEVSSLCGELLSIPMNNGVESLNVAVTAGLIAFLKP